MTIADWEVWACANELIRRHGEDAAIRAAMRADELFDAGAIDGAATFRRIVDCINALTQSPTAIH